jgi:hypothetical protein
MTSQMHAPSLCLCRLLAAVFLFGAAVSALDSSLLDAMSNVDGQQGFTWKRVHLTHLDLKCLGDLSEAHYQAYYLTWLQRYEKKYETPELAQYLQRTDRSCQC